MLVRALLIAGEERLRRGAVKVREWVTACLVRRDVPLDNNGSKRVICNVKVKVSGQWRSAAGTEAYAALRSVIETALKQGVRPLDALAEPALLSL